MGLMKFWKNAIQRPISVSEDNPLPVVLSSGDQGGGTTENVSITGQSAGLATEEKQDEMITSMGSLATAAKQDEIVQAIEKIPTPPTWQGVGEILEGEVNPNSENDYPKLIDLSAEGATAIWIQAAPDNTAPLRVGNVQGFSAAWVSPGESLWFYHPVLYISTDGEDAQHMAFQAKKYG